MPVHSRSKSSEEPKRDRRLELADRLIEHIEQGTAPWQKPWAAREVEAPRNAVTGKPYRGVNLTTLLTFSPDPTDPRWMTYKQAESQGWQVRKGEHAGAYIEKYTDFERKPTEEEIAERLAQGVEDPYAKVKAFSVRHYPVFHASQIDGIPPLEREPLPEIEGKPDERLPKLVEAMGVSFAQSGGRAYYRLDTDHVQMPDVASFALASGHDTTLLHELSHATMHESRLDRGVEHDGFGGHAYAKEELRAEMSAAMTAMHLGIGHDPDAVGVEQGRENSAAYLAGWLKALPEKDRKQILMDAIRDAQKMSDYLIERTPEIEIGAPEQKLAPAVEEQEFAPAPEPRLDQIRALKPAEIDRGAPFLGGEVAWGKLAGVYHGGQVVALERRGEIEYLASEQYVDYDGKNPQLKAALPRLPEDAPVWSKDWLGKEVAVTPRIDGMLLVAETPELVDKLNKKTTEMWQGIGLAPKSRYAEKAAPEKPVVPLDRALTALENHTITLRTPDGEKAVNARRYLDIGIKKHGMTAVDEKNGAVLWKNPETGKEKTITDEKLSAVLCSAAKVDKDIGRAIASVEKKQSAELEI